MNDQNCREIGIPLLKLGISKCPSSGPILDTGIIKDNQDWLQIGFPLNYINWY